MSEELYVNQEYNKGFRIDNKGKNFSFFDCVGYVFAIENNIKFITGDREFQSMEGVEFVK